MGDPVTLIAKWLEGLLAGWGLAEGPTAVVMNLIGVIMIVVFVMIMDVFLVWVERKVVARFQDRFGPNRLGPFGLIQPIADVIKMLIKENIYPQGIDRFIYNLAPLFGLFPVLLLWAVIPISPTTIGTDINVAVLYLVACGAFISLGIIMAGWASNNKYALLGAFREVAQMISYEIPMVISLLIPVILARSMELNQIIQSQNIWYIVAAPLAALVFLISSIAELGRAPFDIAEGESELIAGFHIEYTGMKFGMFYAGELLHALTVGGIFSSLFLGGWRGIGAMTYPIVGTFWFFIKAYFIYWVIMWVKYSLPRIRIDQMLNLNWKFFTPLSLVLLMVTAVLDKLLTGVPMLIYFGVMLAANILIGWGTVLILRKTRKKEAPRVAEPKPIARPDGAPPIPAITPATTSQS
ncbi:MAG: NADH-quinone oxidoreductase subunit NuoH [Anaerolineales bacterium]|nr:NADH-quinone oxidoreductase subunit NuoH [Anaerolineales bacterium]